MFEVPPASFEEMPSPTVPPLTFDLRCARDCPGKVPAQRSSARRTRDPGRHIGCHRAISYPLDTIVTEFDNRSETIAG